LKYNSVSIIFVRNGLLQLLKIGQKSMIGTESSWVLKNDGQAPCLIRVSQAKTMVSISCLYTNMHHAQIP